MRWSPSKVNNRTDLNWLTQWEYAHRGLHGDRVPENSLQGARLAIEVGLGIECDIQRSRDDQPIVFHDWELSRLIGVQDDVADLDSSDLQRLHYRDSIEHPATLGQLLELINGSVPLLIEIKSRRGYDVERSCKIVADAVAGYHGHYAVMSFDPRVARWFRRYLAGTIAGLVMREDDEGFTQKPWQRWLAFWFAKPDFLAYHIAALPNPWVARLRAKGLPILTWTVNSPETRQCALANTDALIAEGAGLA